MKRLILLCLLTFPLVACVRERALTREMDRVETCVNERPDSALTILRQIDTTSLLKPSEKARYALLYAMALDKKLFRHYRYQYHPSRYTILHQTRNFSRKGPFVLL